MSFDTSMQRIAHWLDREDEALLYEPDCGVPLIDLGVLERFRWEVAARYPEGIATALFPLLVAPDIGHDGTLRWPADDPLGLATLDASEE